MAKVFTFDAAKCNGCFNCQLACKDEHADNDWYPYAAAQPPTGQFWVRVEENMRGSTPKVRIHYVAKLCNHCANAPCVPACPHEAIYRRGQDGLVLIDPKKCTGCGECQSACPYGVIYHNEELGICQKCTGCAHLLDNGYSKPRCVEACPTDALEFGDEEDMQDFIEGAGVLRPETAAGPRVYYRNIPGMFIGGTVYDPALKEVVIGAKCRATVGGKTYHTVTDNYGDFWFNDLPVGVFRVVITADGYEPKVFERLHTRQSVNLDDIPLERSAKKTKES